MFGTEAKLAVNMIIEAGFIWRNWSITVLISIAC